ncbi:hypothetical protein SAMN02799624_05306 [Paenibacillus sp. UNC496MF]|nr:hypothetical protein SAMN02799624_05306 [Paenibacillus sp. UNC496MF]
MTIKHYPSIKPAPMPKNLGTSSQLALQQLARQDRMATQMGFRPPRWIKMK